jgi:hypothetical protein
MGPDRRLLSLTFLSQQSFGYCPRAKRSRSYTRAGVVGDLFETAHHAIAPMWQPGAYIRSCELSSVVERTHGNLARKTKGWVEHEFHHAVENSRGIIAVPAARTPRMLGRTKWATCRIKSGPSRPRAVDTHIAFCGREGRADPSARHRDAHQHAVSLQKRPSFVFGPPAARATFKHRKHLGRARRSASNRRHLRASRNHQ